METQKILSLESKMTIIRTGGQQIKRSELRSLITGHSHEDIDAFFALVAQQILTAGTLQTPDDMVALLQTWLDENPSIRSHEPERISPKCWAKSCFK